MGYEKKPPAAVNNHEVAVSLLQDNDNSQSDPSLTKTPPIWLSKRLLLTILLFYGYVNFHSLKSNLNIALVEMTNNKTIVVGENQTIVIPEEFNWDSNTKALVISMFSYGYLLSGLGGHISTKFGGSTTYGVSMLVAGVITILTPVCLYVHFYLFLAARVLAGLADGIAYAATVEVLARWIPLQERSRLMSYSISGAYVGAAITYPSCGYLAHRWGWPVVFYSTGTVCLTAAALWLFFIRNDPSKDKWISKEELAFIKQNVENTPRKQVVHPYRSILTSVPFWAFCFAKFAYSWGYSLLIMCFPFYVKDMTNKSTDQVGLISSIPNFVCIFVVPITGTLMDYCQNKSNLKINQVHKILMSVGFVFGACLLTVPGFITNFSICMICFVLIKIVLAFNFLILQLATIYMAPKHSSVLAGFASFWYIVSAILSLTAMGLVVTNHKWEEWRTIFFLASGVLMAGAVIFALFGSSKLQPWAVSGLPLHKDDGTLDANKDKQPLKQ